MADPLGIIGVIAVVGQIISLTVKIGLDWKDAPDDAKSFLNETQTLKTVLSETHTNIITNEDFKAAFEGRRSALLLELGNLNSTQPTSTLLLVQTCKQQLDALLSDLKKGTEGHRFGWERFKGAFINKRTKETMKDLHRQCQHLNSLVNIDGLRLGVETHKEVKQARQEQKDWQNEQRSKEILDWLSEADHQAQQGDFYRRRQAGTGQWLLDSQEYRQWVATPQTKLFCPGIPGAGKTMLTAIVVDDLQSRFRDDIGVSVAFLYCNFRRQTEQTVENLLSSILRQLAQDQPSLPECVQALYDAKRGMRPSLEQLSSTLQVLVKTLPRAFIIIDALDECQMEEGTRAEFLDEIFLLQLGSNVSLFATSRFIKDITDRFSDAQSLEIRANEEDVRRYLAGSISQLPACVAKNPRLQEEIMTKIVEAVDGMFLLAQLHLNSLKGKRSAKIIKTALEALHTGSGAYDKAYDDAMERIAGQLKDQAELARQVLMWITCAMRPLKIIELQGALAVELGESELDPDNIPEIEDILSVCAGLVTVDDESNIIRLVHYTTQEYFSRNSDRWFPGAHCIITKTCITYLSFDMFNITSDIGDKAYETLEAEIVLYYAFHHWVDHASMPESEPCNQMVSDFISRRLLITCGVSKAMRRLFNNELPELADTWSSFGQERLAYASRIGSTRHVQYLLQRGALINAEDSLGWTPLSGAVHHKHIGTVKVLLEWHGVDVNLQDSSGDTPLFRALESGEREITDMLLCAEGIDRTVVSEEGQTLLHAAASGGLEDIVNMFLDMDYNKGNLNAQDKRGEIPLHLAARHGSTVVIQVLLDIDPAAISAKNKAGQTPLHLATVHCHLDAIRVILGLDATAIKTRDELGLTPLHAAVKTGSEAITRFIYDFDNFAITATTRWGATPLHLAADNGHEALIQLLHSFDDTAVNAKTESGATPLHLAADHGHEATVQTLLSLNNIEVNARANDGSTPLHTAAASMGSLQILKSLLKTGKLTADDEDNYGMTPIWVAARRHQLTNVVYMMSVEEIDPNHTDWRGYTLLHCTVEAGAWEVLLFLLDSGHFHVNQLNKDGVTPLWLAVDCNQPGVVDVLLGIDGVGIGLNVKDSQGRTALALAAERGYDMIVRLLEEAHEMYGVEHGGV